MNRSTAQNRLKQIVDEAVQTALAEQKDTIAAAVIEAFEDIGLVRAMEEADSENADPKEIHRLLKRGRRET